MSAGALAAVTPVSYPFLLTIGPKLFTSVAPVPFAGEDGLTPCTIRETGEGSPNQLTFSVEDPDGTVTFVGGEEVQLIDRRSGSEFILFGGHLVEWVSNRRGGGKGRILTCTAMGYDAWLDWRVVVSWSSKTNKNGRITKIDSERAMVQQLVNRFAGFIDAPDNLITNQNTTMDVVSVRKMTLREAIDRVGQTATYADDDSTRTFYVDNRKRLHYRRGSENLTAPYRIGDGSYIRDVLGTSGLVAFWPLREESGTTAHEAVGALNGTLTGGYTQGVTGGVVNEPSYRAVTLNGSSGYMTATGAALHPGDTFSFECWFKRDGTGATQMLWDGTTGDIGVRFDAGDTISLLKMPNTIWTTDDAFTDTDDWHHLVVTKSGSTRRVYVDGALRSGSGFNQTMVAASGSIDVGRRNSAADRYFDGSLQMVALYDTALSAATVLAHYNQGVTIIPDTFSVTGSAFDGREAVYVSGGTQDGTGWIRNPSIVRSAFGTPGRQPERQEIIDRDDSEGPAKRRAYGRWFLKEHNDPTSEGEFSVVGYDGWRVGQTVYITSVPDNLDGFGAEIKQIDTDVGFGKGVLTYTIQWGRRKWSGARTVSKGQKGRR